MRQPIQHTENSFNHRRLPGEERLRSSGVEVGIRWLVQRACLHHTVGRELVDDQFYKANLLSRQTTVGNEP